MKLTYKRTEFQPHVKESINFDKALSRNETQLDCQILKIAYQKIISFFRTTRSFWNSNWIGHKNSYAKFLTRIIQCLLDDMNI